MTEFFDSRQKILYRVLRLQQPLAVRDVAAGLHCEAEAGRRLFVPHLYGVIGRQPVETVVDLYRVKVLHVPT